MPSHAFVHRIDPILWTAAGIHLWWYVLPGVRHPVVLYDGCRNLLLVP
jgi:hypothetical protein